MVMSLVIGSTSDFAVSWFSTGATLIAPPTLVAVLLLQSVSQQFHHNFKFKELILEALNDKDVKNILDI